MSQEKIVKILFEDEKREFTAKDLKAELPELSLNTLRTNLLKLRKHKEVNYRIAKQNVIFYKHKD